MVRRSRFTQFTNEQWERVDPLLPSNEGRKGRPFEDNRRVVEGIVYRYRTGIPWRDLPERFGPWQTVWKRHRRYAVDGTWDRVLMQILAEADAAVHEQRIERAARVLGGRQGRRVRELVARWTRLTSSPSSPTPPSTDTGNDSPEASG